MRHALHVLDHRRATWSTVGAVARLQRESASSDEHHDVLLRGRPSPIDRARIAGLHADSSRPKRKQLGAILAWDDASARWCEARRMTFTRIDDPIPIDHSRLNEVDRPTMRRRLDIPAGATVIACAWRDGDPAAQEYIFIRAAALALAGHPVTWIVLDAPPIDAARGATLAVIHDETRLIAPALPPWRLLPACDSLFVESDHNDDPHAAELMRWADAAGVPIIHAHDDQSDDDRRARFRSACQLFSALEADPPPNPAPRSESQSFEDFRADVRDRAAAESAAHS